MRASATLPELNAPVGDEAKLLEDVHQEREMRDILHQMSLHDEEHRGGVCVFPPDHCC